MISSSPLLLLFLIVTTTQATPSRHLRDLYLWNFFNYTNDFYTAKFQTDMLNAVNQERAKEHLSPLCYNIKLNRAAQLHAEDQASIGSMSHNGSNGSTLRDRITAQGFLWTHIGENVAGGQWDVASVMSDWMSSSGHRQNILGDFHLFGFGVAYHQQTNDQRYWTQTFGKSKIETCDLI